MTISSLDALIAAPKQRTPYTKLNSRTATATGWYSMFDLAGQPGAGTLSGTLPNAGVIQDSTIAGYPPLNTFGTNAQGMLSTLDFANTVAGRVAVFDRLWVAGAYSYATAYTPTTVSWASRCTLDPSGNPDYKGLELWVETVTGFTGNETVSVGYTNQAGVASRSTGAVGTGTAPIIGRCWQLPFQAGDSGIQSIQNVQGATGTSGTYNLMILRPLWEGRINIANGGDKHDFLRTGGSQILQTSALYVMFCPDSTSTGIPDLNMTIANG